MNIKIVICFIIICFLPVASASTADVWAAKQSGFIKSNQSLSFENYLVISKTLDNTRADVSIYKNNALVETREFNVNEFKKYDNIMITLLGIYGDYSWISMSKLETKDVFRPLSRTLLKWGETYTIEDYSLRIDTFGSDSVNLVISNKSAEQAGVFSKDDFKDYGLLRIAVREINRTGFVELEFFTNKAPAINAEMSTDKDEYFPDENVLVTINITSDDVQNIVGINVESNPLTEIKPDRFSITGVTGTKSFQSHITSLPERSTISINANIETRDYLNNKYIVNVIKVINTTPVVSITKRVPEETDEENVNVTLQVYNSGTTMENVSVYETVPEEFNLKPLSWRIGIEPGNSTNITYQVSPQKPGKYTFPPTIVKWKIYSTLSKEMVMTVHMPYISITKTAVTNKSLTDVKLVISNIGDRKANVSVSDNIPPGYPAVYGKTTWSGFVEGGESAAITYSLQGIVNVLPDASGTYRDMRGVTRQVQSNVVEPEAKSINANTKKKESVSTPALKTEPYGLISFMILSFIAIGGIIAGVTFAAYLFAKFKRRK
ncbi:MAG: hypothetical protein WC568_01355 [Candidatus Methanoperedens sp.]